MGVTVSRHSSLCVVLHGWGRGEEEFPNWKVTCLSWQGKKKRNPPTWKLETGFTYCFTANNPMRSEGR